MVVPPTGDPPAGSCTGEVHLGLQATGAGAHSLLCRIIAQRPCEACASGVAILEPVFWLGWSITEYEASLRSLVTKWDGAPWHRRGLETSHRKTRRPTQTPPGASVRTGKPLKLSGTRRSPMSARRALPDDATTVWRQQNIYAGSFTQLRPICVVMHGAAYAMLHHRAEHSASHAASAK